MDRRVDSYILESEEPKIRETPHMKGEKCDVLLPDEIDNSLIYITLGLEPYPSFNIKPTCNNIFSGNFQ